MGIPLLHREVLPLHDVLDARVHEVGVEKFAHAERLLHVLIRIDGRDAAAGGAELFVGKALLFEAVHQNVIGHGDDRLIADLQIFGRDGDALRAELVRLLGEVLDVHDHAVAEHVHHALAQNTRRQEIENELPPFVDDGVPRVVPALIAAYDVVVGGQKVHHSALALIAPVDPADRSQHNFLLDRARGAPRGRHKTIGDIIQ